MIVQRSWRGPLAATGIRAVDGDIRIVHSPLSADPLQVTLRMEGLGTTTIDVVGQPARSGGAGGRFTQSTQGHDDLLVRWKTDYRIAASGQGLATVQAPADSWLADLYGSTAMPARAFYGRWSCVDGTIAGPLLNPAA